MPIPEPAAIIPRANALLLLKYGPHASNDVMITASNPKPTEQSLDTVDDMKQLQLRNRHVCRVKLDGVILSSTVTLECVFIESSPKIFNQFGIDGEKINLGHHVKPICVYKIFTLKKCMAKLYKYYANHCPESIYNY